MAQLAGGCGWREASQVDRSDFREIRAMIRGEATLRPQITTREGRFEQDRATSVREQDGVKTALPTTVESADLQEIYDRNQGAPQRLWVSGTERPRPQSCTRAHPSLDFQKIDLIWTFGCEWQRARALIGQDREMNSCGHARIPSAPPGDAEEECLHPSDRSFLPLCSLKSVTSPLCGSTGAWTTNLPGSQSCTLTTTVQAVSQHYSACSDRSSGGLLHIRTDLCCSRWKGISR